MADYIPCCRGEKFFDPTILYTMQHITPYILKTHRFYSIGPGLTQVVASPESNQKKEMEQRLHQLLQIFPGFILGWG